MREIILSLPEKSGIYKITSPTGRIYIGESMNLKNRCKVYLYPSKVKKQRAIYNSLHTHGVDSHVFEILEFCEINYLKERERYYQEFFDSVKNGLNCKYTQTNNLPMIHSDKTREIMSNKSKGENNHFYGKKHSEESLKKISESSKGEKNPNFGGKLKNDDWLIKQSISNSKKNLVVIDTQTGIEITFMNSKECAIFLQTSPSNIRMSKSNNWKIKKRYIIKNVS